MAHGVQGDGLVFPVGGYVEFPISSINCAYLCVTSGGGESWRDERFLRAEKVSGRS